MKILYLSVHSILEFDEVKLFTELGHECFSIGSYINPNTPHDPKRPAIDVPANEYLLNVALQSSPDNLHPKLISWADVIIVMHKPDWVINNWEKIKHKKIVWRSIGQSQPKIEADISLFKAMGLRIIRYSPAEKGIQGYAGADAVIRFYKDPDEFKGYNGNKEAVLTVAQSMKERSEWCGYEIFKQATEGFERNLYGTQSRNPDLTPMNDPLWKGQLSYEELKRAYRDNRVYFYTGTYPASYTLNFIEAMMTGIPIVAIGKNLVPKMIPGVDTYEVDSIIKDGINGFVSDNIDELKSYVKLLLDKPEMARIIGEEGRKTAIELFGKEKIKISWKTFFETL